MPDPQDPKLPGDPTGPEDQDEIDRRWQDIVADLEPLGEPGPPPADTGLERHFAPGPVRGPRDYAVDDEDDGDFVPPEPPALGAGRPALVLSVAGLVGGPACLLLAAIFWPAVPGAIVTVLTAAFVAGAVGFFLSLPRDEDRRNPWNDDGAQV